MSIIYLRRGKTYSTDLKMSRLPQSLRFLAIEPGLQLRGTTSASEDEALQVGSVSIKGVFIGEGHRMMDVKLKAHSDFENHQRSFQ